MKDDLIQEALGGYHFICPINFTMMCCMDEIHMIILKVDVALLNLIFANEVNTTYEVPLNRLMSPAQPLIDHVWGNMFCNLVPHSSNRMSNETLPRFFSLFIATFQYCWVLLYNLGYLAPQTSCQISGAKVK